MIKLHRFRVLGILVLWAQPFLSHAQAPLGPPPAPPVMLGGLQVIVNVPGAKVYLDGQLKGELTPPAVLNIPDIPIGTVQVRVEAVGYQTRALNYQIQAGTWTQAIFALVKQGGGGPNGAIVPLISSNPQQNLTLPILETKPAVPGATQNTHGTWEATVKVGEVSIEMLQIPPGKFRMGSPAGDLDEMPVHMVSFTKPLWIGKYPITQRQWKAVMGYNPSKFKDAGSDAPVESVSWNACEAFLKRMNEKQSDWIFRLPSEAEWEYACRAGSTGTRYGDSLKEIAWFKDNSEGTTHPVGQKQPNAWGLYDMLGNVWQWCHDYQHDNYENAPTDGTAWIEGTYFYVYGVRAPMGSGWFKPLNMIRGGSWNRGAEEIRSANRERALSDISRKDLGFRLVGIPN